MKKIVALLIALVMMISVCACTQVNEPAPSEPVSTTPRPDDRTHRGAHHCGAHRRTRQSAFR